MGGRTSAPWRALLRWNWRLFRRDWRKQFLVLALMTVAVAGAVVWATLATTLSSAHDRDFGSARAMATLDATVPARARAGVAAMRARYGHVEVISHASVAVRGSALPVDVRAQDPRARFGRPLLRLTSGRFPARRDEVALTSAVATLLSARIGTRVELGGVERLVVGLVENPSDLADEFALVAPAGRAAADSLTLLFDDSREGPTAVAGTSRNDINFPISTRGDSGPIAALVLAVATLGMALVGLIATAGFVVVAQRRQRQFGLLAAIGATPRHLRIVMVANGALIGTAGALLGAALALAGWIIAAPALEVPVGHRIDRLDLPWGLIAACASLAILMSALAAWWPARALSRRPVLATLTGRPPRPLPTRRSLVVAGVLLVLGGGGIATANPTGNHSRPLLLVAGIVAIVVGVVFITPSAIRALAAPAGRLPFAARLALRDLVRYQARAAAALAAITLGAGISIAAIAIAGASAYRSGEGNLSARQILIRVGDPRTDLDPRLTQADRNRLDAGARRVSTTLGDPALLTLDVAMTTATASDPSRREPIALAKDVDADTTRLISYPYVATAALLRHYRIDVVAIRSTTDLLTVRSDVVRLLDYAPRARATPPLTPIQHVRVPLYTSAPNSLITEGAMRRHHWIRVRAGWLAESSRPLTATQIAAARSVAADLGLTIESRSRQSGLAAARRIATAGGVLLALAIVAMTVGLIRSESGNDLRTLTATGADRRTRRALTASTAGTLALLGVALGALGAYLALLAGYHAQPGKLTPLPVSQLLALLLGLPVSATIAGWLLGGREPRTFTRQVLD